MSAAVLVSPVSSQGTVTRQSLAENHFRNLDLLRAVAVLCVLASHIGLAMGVRTLGSLGRFGVIMFFFHTSFVLMQSLERMSRTAAGWRLSLAFWIRRAFRIYPLAMLAVFAAVAFHVPVNGVGAFHPVGLKTLLSNLALTQNLIYADPVLGPLWSLPLEVQMYVLLPMAFLLLRRWRLHPALVWVLSVVLASTLPHINDRLGVFRVGPCFTAGILAFQLETKRRPRLAAWTWPLSLVVVALIFGPFDNVSLEGKIYLAWVASLLLALAYVLTKDAGAGIVTKAAHYFAEISYGVYLAHIFLIWLAVRLFARGVVADCFFAVGVIVVPAALFRFVERPFMAFGRLLSQRAMEWGQVSQKTERTAVSA